MATSTQLSLSTAEQLQAIEEIKRVQYRYVYSADHHRWDDVASVFAEDALFDEHDFPVANKPGTKEHVPAAISAYLEAKASGTQWPVIGRTAIYEQLAGVPADHMMIHHLFNPEVDLTSNTTAKAVFRFESHHWLPDGQPAHYMHNFGIYHETFERLDGGRWYIKTLQLSRTRVECS